MIFCLLGCLIPICCLFGTKIYYIYRRTNRKDSHSRSNTRRSGNSNPLPGIAVRAIAATPGTNSKRDSNYSRGHPRDKSSMNRHISVDGVYEEKGEELIEMSPYDTVVAKMEKIYARHEKDELTLAKLRTKAQRILLKNSGAGLDPLTPKSDEPDV